MPEVAASAIASLSPRELEILKLLAKGHTAKSIAARLGKTETAIHERLRDARRKTGIGSSRELARIVDAQEIWDKNIGLFRPVSSAEGAIPPADRGRTMTKGLMMILPIALAASTIVMLAADDLRDAPGAVGARDAVAGQPPLVGKWSLDVSTIPADERPRSVTLDFRVSGDQLWTGKSEIVGKDGSRQHAEATGPVDGSPIALNGNMVFADSVSMRQPAPNTLVITFTKAGKTISTRVYTIEDGGNAMKETISWAADVTPRMVTTFFTRVG